MRGYIRKRDKDVWQLVVDLPKDPISGKRRQKYVTVHGSKRKADFELQKLLSEAQQSRARDSSVLVESAIREWITLVSQNLSPTTVRGYMGWIDLKIVPALGMLPLADVTAAHLDRLYRDLTVQGSAPASVRQVHAIITPSSLIQTPQRIIVGSVGILTMMPASPKSSKPLPLFVFSSYNTGSHANA